MARVKGREVVVALLDAVAKLERTTSAHAEKIEAIATLAMGTSTRVHGLSLQMADLAHGFRELSHRVDVISTRLDGVSTRVDELDEDLKQQAEQLLASAKLSRVMEQQLGQVARLLASFADGSRSRFESIEDRLDDLERKAS